MLRNLLTAGCLAAAVLLAGCAAGLAQRDVFFAGGRYVGAPGKEVMRGAMYVEHLRPQRVTQRYPLVLVHGSAQTAVNWMTTPDGRPGWAQFFTEQGYEVYLVDQPARGRSAWHPGVDGELRNFPVTTVETAFTTADGNWPQAKLHTQWPGSGKKGDPTFDQFYASQVEYVGSDVDTQSAMQAAGAALLDRIGPAVLVTHSQGGPLGWLIADARPALVKGIVALEPQGPPVLSATGGRRRAQWGVTDVPLTYAPAVPPPGELQVQQQAAPAGSDLQACWVQTAPARQLVNLTQIPVLVLTTEASYHVLFDHCTAQWLSQAGVPTELLHLERLGIHGNGHMVMLEKNNLQVAGVVSAWVSRTMR